MKSKKMADAVNAAAANQALLDYVEKMFNQQG